MGFVKVEDVFSDRWLGKRLAVGGVGRECGCLCDGAKKEAVWIATSDGLCGETRAERRDGLGGWFATELGCAVDEAKGEDLS